MEPIRSWHHELTWWARVSSENEVTLAWSRCGRLCSQLSTYKQAGQGQVCCCGCTRSLGAMAVKACRLLQLCRSLLTCDVSTQSSPSRPFWITDTIASNKIEAMRSLFRHKQAGRRRVWNLSRTMHCSSPCQSLAEPGRSRPAS